MNDITEILRSLIGRYFKDEFYEVSITNVRQAIKERPHYRDNWELLIRTILFKELPEGQALKILDEDGNLILHANTEEEAYKWLMLMVVNVSRGNEETVLDEREFLKPNKGTDNFKPIA